mgnify:CR=1 FL=1
MQELPYNAKLATLRLLNDILKADNVICDSEIEFFNQIIESFSFTTDYKQDFDNLVTLQALSIVQDLDASQKNLIARLMGQMIVIDNDINYDEVKLYNIFCKLCNIDLDFNLNDYPECSLSGPFTNPEDI